MLRRTRASPFACGSSVGSSAQLKAESSIAVCCSAEYEFLNYTLITLVEYSCSVLHRVLHVLLSVTLGILGLLHMPHLTLVYLLIGQEPQLLLVELVLQLVKKLSAMKVLFHPGLQTFSLLFYV